MKHSGGMLARIRKESIVELVDAQGSVSVSDLCKRFGVSPATIRNDLHELETERRIGRTHGGAVSCHRVANELDPRLDSMQQTEEKERIAAAALEHIRPGDAIALDTGSTIFHLARRLGSIRRLNVVTNDLQIAAWLDSNTDVTLIMAGGLVRHNFHCTAGQAAIDSLSRLHVDRLFLSANAVNEGALFTPSMEAAAVKSAMLGMADEVILLADSSKLGRKAFAKFADITQIHTLITDQQADPAFVAALREVGVQVETV